MELASVAGNEASHDREWAKRHEQVDGGSADEGRNHVGCTAVVGRSRRSMTPQDKTECGRNLLE